MNSKWLKIILAASLAFNLAFISAAIYQRVIKKDYRHNHLKRKVKEPTGNLDLNKDQRSKINEIIKKFKFEKLQYKQEILDKRIAIIEAMNDIEFNPEDIETRTAELNQLENQLNLSFVEALIQINHILDSKQRMEFLLRLSRNWFFMNRGRHRGPPGGGKND
jgi:Spy/CpxP family protein refolding chaperone